MAFDKANVDLTNMNAELNQAIEGAGFEGMPEHIPGSLEKANRLKNDYGNIVRTIDILMGRVAQGNRKAANDKLAKASLESLKTLVEKSYDDSQNSIINRNTAVAEIANANTEAAAAAAIASATTAANAAAAIAIRHEKEVAAAEIRDATRAVAEANHKEAAAIAAMLKATAQASSLTAAIAEEAGPRARARATASVDVFAERPALQVHLFVRVLNVVIRIG
jgi:hypothetical protein